MAKKFSGLEEAMAPASRARSDAQFHALLKDMPLHELRRARGLSQQNLADVLHVGQPAIAKLEHRADMYISTLRSHIEAMGGVLEIVARFPDGSVNIRNFGALQATDA
jgi:ribosome-binding protein aMBF1 (putative translation factor)